MGIVKLLANNGYFVVNRNLARLIGLNEAIIFGELCSEYDYWESRSMLDDGEWFYSTADNIEKNTTIKRKTQDRTIASLKEKGLIETKLKGVPAKRYIKINEQVVGNLLGQNVQTGLVKMTELDGSKGTTNNNKLNNNNNSNKYIDDIWSLYPNKKGKARAVTKIPKLVDKYGYEQIVRCIERYNKEIAVKKTSPDYISHGSTFFNGAYMDYLDDNYQEPVNSSSTFKSTLGSTANPVGLNLDDV